MRNWMKRKLIAFSLAVILVFLQFTPVSGISRVQAAGRNKQAVENADTASGPDTSMESGGTTSPSPVVTEKPAYNPDQIDAIPATGGAAFISDPFVNITGLSVKERTSSSIKLSWDAIETMPGKVSGYYIYMYDASLKDFVYVTAVSETTYTLKDLPAGQEFYFTVSAYDEENLLQTMFCPSIQTYTRPERLADIAVKTYTKSAITIQWEQVASATGYIIYRATETGSFVKVGTVPGTVVQELPQSTALPGASALPGTSAVPETSATPESPSVQEPLPKLEYVDTGLSLGTTYRYMIRTYAYVEDNTSEEDSNILYMTTKAKAPTISAIKGGTNRVRIKWKKVTGANGYTIRRYNGKKYVVIAQVAGVDTLQYINTGLANNVKYQYKVCAYRTVKGVKYDGLQSDMASATPVQVAKTSKSALLYKTKKAFKKSPAYKTCSFFRKKVSYAKSIIIPGLQNTNVAGFGCSTMVPQGMTFAKSYLMVAAYDKSGAENSVIYVINKSTKKLATTVVLPSRLHAGGLAFDGTNIWVTHTTNLYCIKYSKIKSAISKKANYVELPAYATVIEVGQKAGSLCYYKSLLWIGSYNETSSGYLGSYQILNKKSAAPSLLLKRRIKIANRVQGFAFTSNGYLVLSRSCQTDKSKRGFLHQLDVYKPNLKKAKKGIIKLGRIRKRVDMPSMNEEIAVSGKYLYVNYESGAFANAVNRMDRICAFKVSAVVKK